MIRMGTRVFDRVRRLAARLRPDRIPLLDPPLSFVDDREREIAVRAYRPEDFDGLTAMYDDFDPALRAQGTPPVGTESVRDWLDGVLEGPDVVALHDEKPVGHVSFVPDGTGRHELAIFVHQDYQRAGVGTTLMAAGLGHAGAEGVGYVWLSVESWKRGIQRFYARAGFSVVNPMGAAHRMSRTL